MSYNVYILNNFSFRKILIKISEKASKLIKISIFKHLLTNILGGYIISISIKQGRLKK